MESGKLLHWGWILWQQSDKAMFRLSTNQICLSFTAYKPVALSVPLIA